MEIKYKVIKPDEKQNKERKLKNTEFDCDCEKIRVLTDKHNMLIKELLETKDISYAQHILKELDKTLENFRSLSASLLKEYMPITKVEHNRPYINIEKENNLIHFSFYGNLPHKEIYDKSERRVRYEYDKNEYFSWCRDSVMKFFEEEGSFVFQEKCAALFISYYAEESRLVDHDNLDVKYFIDGALRPFLTGDGPLQLSLLFDGDRAEENKTEVIFGPASKVYEYVSIKITS